VYPWVVRQKDSLRFIRLHRKIFLIGILSLSFFCFIDDRFRGWWDTNQYFVEARAWRQGQKPPVPDLVENVGASWAPAYSAPLVPYTWAHIEGANERTNLRNVRIFQALLVSFCFAGLFFYLNFNFVIPLLLFCNPFTRDLIFWPMTEPQSVALLFLPYLMPRLAGVSWVLQIVTRPAVAFLHLPNLWRNRFSWTTYLGAGATFAFIFMRFGHLVIPATPPGIGHSWVRCVEIYKSLAEEATNEILTRRWPASLYFILYGILGWGVWRVCRKFVLSPVICAAIGAYIYVITLPFAVGVRYFFPLLFFIALEWSDPARRAPLPKLSIPSFWRPGELARKWPRVARAFTTLIVCIALYNGIRHLFAIDVFRRDRMPNADTPGLNAAKSWLKTQNLGGDTVMMFYVRYCLNFFELHCMGYPLDQKTVKTFVKEHHVRYVIFTGQSWIVEEMRFLEDLKKNLKINDADLEKQTLHFEEVKIMTMAPLL